MGRYLHGTKYLTGEDTTLPGWFKTTMYALVVLVVVIAGFTLNYCINDNNTKMKRYAKPVAAVLNSRDITEVKLVDKGQKSEVIDEVSVLYRTEYDGVYKGEKIHGSIDIIYPRKYNEPVIIKYEITVFNNWKGAIYEDLSLN